MPIQVHMPIICAVHMNSGLTVLNLILKTQKMINTGIFFLKTWDVAYILQCNTNWLSKRFVFLTFLGRFLPIKLRPLFGAVFFFV